MFHESYIGSISVLRSTDATFEQWKEKLAEVHGDVHLDTKFLSDLEITETEAFLDRNRHCYVGCFYDNDSDRSRAFVYPEMVFRG